VQLQKDLNRINDAGIDVVAVSYDSVDTLKAFAEKKMIQFPLLSDEKSEAIDAYHIRNQGVKKGSRLDGIPHPGTFLLDSDGVIRAKLFYTVRKRHGSDELIEAAESIR
jgi:peroxiredoxin